MRINFIIRSQAQLLTQLKAMNRLLVSRISNRNISESNLNYNLQHGRTDGKVLLIVAIKPRNIKIALGIIN